LPETRTAALRNFAALRQFVVFQRGARMFLFFSNRLGLLGSIAISAVLTLLLLSFCNVI
jgi:hypothetical protein